MTSESVTSESVTSASGSHGLDTSTPRGPQAAVLGAPDLDALPAPIREDPNPGLSRRALHLVYDLLWLLATLVGSPWLLWKCFSTPGFARMVRERLGFGLASVPAPKPGRPRVLVHGVSVGEIKAAVSIVRALEEQRPDLEVVLCATTDTGMQVARDLFPEHLLVRFPADLAPCVRRFLRRVGPACAVLVELEIWPNLLRRANRAGIPVAVVNGRITHKSFGQYRLFRHLLPQFNRISLFCVQAEEYAERFRGLYVPRERVVITGNVKVDGLPVGRLSAPPELVRCVGAQAGQPVLVAGSTHEPEESWVVRAWAECAPEARLVLVPRHPRRAAELVRSLTELGARPQLYTQLMAGEESQPERPLIVDTIGQLESIYALATVVYVGGSLVPHGGQNVLEPAAQALPVLTGPHVWNFTQEVALLEGAGGLERLEEVEQLGPALARLLGNPDGASERGRRGQEAVRSQAGATALTLAALERSCLPPSPRGGDCPSPSPGLS